MPIATHRAKSNYRRAWAAWWVLVALLSLATLAGCRTTCKQWCDNGFKVGPNYRKPCVDVAPDWLDADDKRVLTTPVDHVAWWAESFHDPVLNQLVAQAYRQNLTLREAGARIAEARALRVITVGNFFPQQQDYTAQYSHNLRTGVGDRHFSVWQGQFSLAWELDFWGRYRRAIEAADADLEATVFDYGDVVVTLVADVAATYVDIRTLQTRLRLVQSNVQNQRRTYEIAELRFTVGDISEVDVLQAASNLAQTEAQIPQLELALRQTQNQLCVLLGVSPRNLTAMLGAGQIPDVEQEIAVGIPADLLVRRPDVRRAERQLAAQSALIGVAESDFYPHITLRGNVGRSANQFKEVFEPGAGFGSVGPTLRWDFLHYGRLMGNVHVQDARFQQLLAFYRQAVIQANAEAENAITLFLKSQETLKLQLTAAEAAAKTNEKINLQLEEGEVDYNRVFNVQSFKTQQETAAALAKGDVAQGLIAIYRAMGGGWPSPFLSEAILEPNRPEAQSDPAEEIDPPGSDETSEDILEKIDEQSGIEREELPPGDNDAAPIERHPTPDDDALLRFPEPVAPREAKQPSGLLKLLPAATHDR